MAHAGNLQDSHGCNMVNTPVFAKKIRLIASVQRFTALHNALILC
jgi:hypothetical protein